MPRRIRNLAERPQEDGQKFQLALKVAVKTIGSNNFEIILESRSFRYRVDIRWRKCSFHLDPFLRLRERPIWRTDGTMLGRHCSQTTLVLSSSNFLDDGRGCFEIPRGSRVLAETRVVVLRHVPSSGTRTSPMVIRGGGLASETSGNRWRSFVVESDWKANVAASCRSVRRCLPNGLYHSWILCLLLLTQVPENPVVPLSLSISDDHLLLYRSLLNFVTGFCNDSCKNNTNFRWAEVKFWDVAEDIIYQRRFFEKRCCLYCIKCYVATL